MSGGIGHYQTPIELKDEDTYFKFFTKTELVYVLVALVPSFFLCRGAWQSGSLILLYLALTISFLLVVGILVCLKIKLPERMYLVGCGMPIYIILIRLIRKAFQKKKIYINNYEERALH